MLGKMLYYLEQFYSLSLHFGFYLHLWHTLDLAAIARLRPENIHVVWIILKYSITFINHGHYMNDNVPASLLSSPCPCSRGSGRFWHYQRSLLYMAETTEDGYQYL